MPGAPRGTFTNPTSPWGAAEILNVDGGQSLRVSHGLPWYRTSDYANLGALWAAAGAGPYNVIVNSNIAVTANRAFAAGIHLVFQPDFQITVNNAVTFTIYSPENVHAGARQRCFTLVGTGALAWTSGGRIQAVWFASFAVAVASVGVASGMTISLATGQIVLADLTVPATVNLEFTRNAAIQVNNGITLTIHSPEHIQANPRACIFNLVGTGLVRFSHPGTVHPGWWGALADGVADDTLPIRAAINAAIACTLSGNSGIYGDGAYVGTAPTVYFAAGIYRITGYLTEDVVSAVNYLRFAGERSIIVAGAVTIFGGIAYNVVFEGLTFRGGNHAISIKTNNINGTIIDVTNCEFHRQEQACIIADNNSNSTLLNVRSCKFRQDSAALAVGDIAYLPNVGIANFVDCWFQVASARAFYVGTGTGLYLRDCQGVPTDDLVAAGGAWIENHSASSLELIRFRMGAENGGAACLIRNYATMDVASPVVPSRILIEDCPIYCQPDTIRFYDLPNVVILRHNHGLGSGNTRGFWFDDTIPLATLTAFQRYGVVAISDNFNELGRELWAIMDPAGTQQAIAAKIFATKAAESQWYRVEARDRLAVADVAGSGEMAEAGWAGSTSNTSAAYGDDPYAVAMYVVTATADGGYRVRHHDTYLVPTVLTPYEIYTLVLHVDLTAAAPALLYCQIGNGAPRYYNVAGKGVICIPFVYLNGTGAPDATLDQWYWQVTLAQSGDIFHMGRHVLLKGIVKTGGDVLELVTAAAPGAHVAGITPNTGYFRGDLAWASNVTGAGSIGWVCTAEGAPGTWKTWGVVAA